MQNGNNRERKASIIAAAITFGVALVILVLLFVLTVGNDRRLLSETSIPEIQDDEEVFLEPELLMEETPGEEDGELDVPEAPQQPPGEPDRAPEEQPVKVVKNLDPPKEPPVSNKEKLVSTDKPSEVKTSTPKVSDEDTKRLAAIGNSFNSPNNGNNASQVESPGSVVASGKLSGKGSNGRNMLSCPRQTVSASQKTVIKVSIVVGENGNVKSATALSGNSKQRQQCEQMARQSKWTPAPGEGDEQGTITFTIIPK